MALPISRTRSSHHTDSGRRIWYSSSIAVRLQCGPTMPLRLLLAASIVLVLGSPAFAQPSLDPEASGPCLWRIVVKTEPHPLLTGAFRDQLRRDLIAALQPAIGPLGTVDVIDLDDALAGKTDSLVQDFAAKG